MYIALNNISCWLLFARVIYSTYINTLRPGQNGHFADDIFEYIFLKENYDTLIQISLKFIPKC